MIEEKLEQYYRQLEEFYDMTGKTVWPTYLLSPET